MKRSEIVEEARRYVELGTRWARMGRSERQMDCYGLISAVAKKFGVRSPEEYMRYELYPTGALLMKALRAVGVQVHPPFKPGMFLVFSFDGEPRHVGIYSLDRHGRPSVIHCSPRNRRCVCEEPFDELKRNYRAAFDLPGVEEDA